HVTQEQFDRLSRGRLAIVRLSGQFQIIPLEAAEKVAERAPHWPVMIAKVEEQPADEDDPYAAYKIPDDLMWLLGRFREPAACPAALCRSQSLGSLSGFPVSVSELRRWRHCPSGLLP